MGLPGRDRGHGWHARGDRVRDRIQRDIAESAYRARPRRSSAATRSWWASIDFRAIGRATIELQRIDPDGERRQVEGVRRVVDWIGVSGYAENQTPGQMFDNFYDEYASRKPIMISEVAVVDHGGRTKADWIASFAAWVKTKPAVGAVVWFDTDTHPGSTEKWRIDSDKQALAAYKAMADDPVFAG